MGVNIGWWMGKPVKKTGEKDVEKDDEETKEKEGEYYEEYVEAGRGEEIEGGRI